MGLDETSNLSIFTFISNLKVCTGSYSNCLSHDEVLRSGKVCKVMTSHLFSSFTAEWAWEGGTKERPNIRGRMERKPKTWSRETQAAVRNRGGAGNRDTGHQLC